MGGAVGTIASALLDHHLINVCKDGDIERLRSILLCENVNMNCYDSDRWTPLMLACKYGNIAQVELLIAAGADTTMTNFLGLTAMHYAIFKDSAALITLLDNASNVQLRKKEKDIIDQLKKKSISNPIAFDSNPVDTDPSLENSTNTV